MQDVTSFVKAQSPLNLSTSGTESKKSSASKGENKNLFSLLLAGLATAKAEIKLDNSSDTITAVPLKEESKNSKESHKKAKSVDEHLLGDLLKIVESLKTNSPLPLLPTLKSGSNLEKIINNQTALKEFAEVKSINDVLSLSKKYNLSLEKLTFTKESVESLQKEFPTLAKSSFFQTLKETVNVETPLFEENVKTPKTINPLEKNIKKSEIVEAPSSLKELMSKDAKIVKAEETVSKEVKIVKTEETVSKETKVVDTSSKTTAQKTVETIVIQKTIMPLKEDIKEAKVDKTAIISPTIQQTSDEEIVEIKPTIQTRTNEPKVELQPAHKGLTEAILQTIKHEKAPIHKPTVETEAIQTELVPSDNSMHTESIADQSVEAVPFSNDIKLSTKQEIPIKQVIVPKESLNQFANDLKEKVEAYKPPIMKVELSLFPKSLGEVDVTLLTRGNNLHVNITSNSSTMTLFTQNQAEFKNALVNMGFTNLEMNFSDQRHNENQQHKNQKNNEAFFEEFSTEQNSNDIATIEVVIPRYV